ncbi:unnamed protein product [Cuscuta europaea]|uniref:Uncharacterized protein n=1 Tax=Cuscuta europaea TaxID=41803 RepID=A0A9P0YLM5_CUSEU|nr:unnamed protein product [Cuscuta europaea]
MDPVLLYVEQVVSDSQNTELLRPIREEEVKAALFSMHPDKSPGSDSLGPGFYQHFREVVGPEVVDFCKGTLRSASSGRGVHWKDWRGLSLPKTRGGLGFRRLREFNLAMLGKQAWKIFTEPDSLVDRVLKARDQKLILWNPDESEAGSKQAGMALGREWMLHGEK